jgi:hypothetical protein
MRILKIYLLDSLSHEKVAGETPFPQILLLSCDAALSVEEKHGDTIGILSSLAGKPVF